MSTLYRASVKSILDQQTVELLVQDVHADPSEMHIPASPAFVLLLLFEGAIDSGSPLEQALDINALLEEKWMENNALGFIEHVQTTSHLLTPTAEEEEDEDFDPEEWYEEVEEENRTLGATVKIKVTHPAWIAHLSPNAKWDSTSYYGEELSYKKCNKVTP